MKEVIAKYKHRLVSVCSIVAVLFIWEMATDILHLISPMMLPSPAKVFHISIYKLTGGVNPDGVTLLQHITASMKIALGGYTVGVVTGVPLGIAMVWNREFEMFAKLLSDVIQPIPVLAWILLMILWLGIGYWFKVGIIFSAAFTSATINSYTGIKRITQVHLWVVRTFGVSNRQMLFKVVIPTALPMIPTGLRLALGSSWVAPVVAGLLVVTRGLGYMIQVARMPGRSDVILVGTIIIGVIGYLLSATLEKLQNGYVKGRCQHGE